MDHFAVIDTETTWSGALMTAGVLIVEADSLKVVDSKDRKDFEYRLTRIHDRFNEAK